MSNRPDNMVTAFENKVISFKQENEQAEQTIIRGSDEHLDILLSIKKTLDPLSEKYSKLLDEIIPSSNKMKADEVNKVMPVLLDLYASSIKLVAVLKRSSIGRDIKSCCQKYYSHVENLHEFIYDLEHFRSSNEDDELNEILKEINRN